MASTEARLVAGLKVCMEEATRALELEDARDVEGAVDNYVSAASQLTLLRDLHVHEHDSPLAGLIALLITSYQRRGQLLRERGMTQTEIQGVCLLDPCSAAQIQMDGSSNLAVSASYAVAGLARGCGTTMATQQPPGLANSQRPEALPVSTFCGTGVHSTCSMSDPGGCSLDHEDESRGVIELLRACQRTVSGSLDDIVGLDSVKEELQESVLLPMRYSYL